MAGAGYKVLSKLSSLSSRFNRLAVMEQRLRLPTLQSAGADPRSVKPLDYHKWRKRVMIHSIEVRGDEPYLFEVSPSIKD